jgi:hypothetical protein
VKGVLAYVRHLLDSGDTRPRSEILFEAWSWVDLWREAYPEEAEKNDLRLEILQKKSFDCPPLKFGLKDYLHNEDAPSRNAFGRIVVY